MLCERFITRFNAITTEPVDFSIGISQVGPVDFVAMDEMLQTTDGLMYEAKEKSRGTTGSHIATKILSREASSEPAAA